MKEFAPNHAVPEGEGEGGLAASADPSRVRSALTS